MEKEDYLFCYGSYFKEQHAQDIKSNSISTVVLPGWIHYQQDPQYGHGPPDEEVRLDTKGSRLLMEVLSSCSSVTSLDLSENNLLLENLSGILSSMSENSGVIKELDLSRNEIDYKGATEIAKFAVANKSSLRKLILAQNQVRGEGAMMIAEAVKVCSNLTSLDLRDNAMGPEGLAACVRMVSKNPFISRLSVDTNGSEDRLVSAVLRHVECNRVRNEFGIELYRDALHSKGLSTTEFEQGAGAYTCNGIDFNYATLKPDRTRAIRIIGSYENIHPAEIRWPAPLKIFDVALTFTGLRYLAAFVSTSSTLISISVPDNKLRDRAIVKIVESFPPHRRVKLLDFHGNLISRQGAQAVARLMVSNKSITSLDLHGNKIDSEGAIAIADAVLGSAELKSINLEDNAIEQPGFQAFVKVIETCPKLTTLMLQHKDPSKSLVDIHTFKSLLQAVKKSTGLSTISLPKCSTIEELQQSWLDQCFGEGTSGWREAVQKHLAFNKREREV